MKLSKPKNKEKINSGKPQNKQKWKELSIPIELTLHGKEVYMHLNIVVGAGGGEEGGDWMEIAGKYGFGVVPIDLNRSTPHFSFLFYF